MPRGSTNIFVSYCHDDAPLVGPVVKLLRVNNSFVFQDVDHIRPGKKWRGEIAKAISDAQLVVVFWCNHASNSIEVSNEWKEAIKQEKDLLPLLLDKTPLPPELSEFQWIDFRGMVGMNHGTVEPHAVESTTSVEAKRFSIIGFATAFIAIMSVSLVTLLNTKDSAPPSHGSPVESPPLPPPIADSAYVNSFLLFFAVAITIIACLMGYMRWRLRRRTVITTATPPPEEFGQIIAKELEVEILRRTKGKQNSATDDK